MHPRPTPCSLSPARRLAAATVVVAAVAAACAGSPATVDTGQAGGPATAPRGSGTTPAAPGTTTTPGTNRQASPACPDGANLDNLSIFYVGDAVEGLTKYYDAGGRPAPPGWEGPRSQPAFDWDRDGQPDRLVVDRDQSTVTVSTAKRDIVVTGVFSNFARLDVGGTGPPEPAIVGDVTGDGNPDLIAVMKGMTKVLVGGGSASAPFTVSFDEIGDRAAGWSIPRAPQPIEKAQVPLDIAAPAVAWDFTGDGINDIFVSSLAGRGGGWTRWYPGQACPYREPAR